MADLAVLEREYQARAEERGAVSAAEIEHTAHISANYHKLMFEDADLKKWADEVSQESVQRRLEAYEEPAVKTYPAPAERIAAYMPAPAPAATGKTLFEGLVMKQGVLVDERAPQTTESVAVPVVAPAPVASPADEEDALPTRRTMETLQHVQSVAMKSETYEETHVGFFASLSVKAKVAMAAVAAAVLLIIALICVNSAVLSGLNADLSALRSQEAELARRSAAITQQVDDLQNNPFNDTVMEWAKNNGWVR